MDTDRQIPRFGLRSRSGWADPFGMYARLRRDSPVHHVSPGPTPADDYWVLTRYADVADAACHPATFSSAAGLTVTRGELEAIGMADNPPLVMQDPPVHTAFRALVARGFTPRQVTTLEPQVHEFVADRLDRLADAARSTDGPLDVVGELLKPLPSMIVAHYLGVPETDRAHFDEWTSAIVGAVGPTAAADGEPVRASAGAATGELLAYFAELIDRRRNEPGDDTVSALVAAGRADDDAGLVSILAFVFTMIAGGNDTTTGLLGGSLELLAAHPDQRARLVADPDLIPDALEELLRLTSPVQGLARTTTRPVAYPDVAVEIPAGVKVLLCYAAANRDPEVFGADADTLDITRRPRRILAFGRGDHHCLGAAAARMAGRIALTELLARFPEFDVDIDGITWAAGNYVRRPTYVPFRPVP
ncbi:cytochrome P450 [Gordonia sp. NPDC003376]